MSINPLTNSVVLGEGTGITPHARRLLGDLGGRMPTSVETRRLSKYAGPVPASCSNSFRTCDPPFRGGFTIGTKSVPTGCTAAFKATDSAGSRFVITAGHCIRGLGEGQFARDSGGGEAHYLGTVDRAFKGLSGADLARINASESKYWNTPSWPTQLVLWRGPIILGESPSNSEFGITSESGSYRGQYVCHVGATSGTTCGYVRTTDLSFETETNESPPEPMWLEHMSEVTGSNFCIDGGDSGGPVYTPGHSAVGIVSAKGEVLWRGSPPRRSRRWVLL
jgi:hypothetical protein